MVQAVHLSFKSLKRADGNSLLSTSDLKSRQLDFYARKDVSRIHATCPLHFNGLHRYLFPVFHFHYEMIFDINFRYTSTVANCQNSRKKRKINWLTCRYTKLLFYKEVH